MAAFAPTSRSALILAVIAVAILWVNPWLDAVAALVLAVAAGVDAWTVRRAPALRRTVAPVLSRGVAAQLRVRANVADRRRVLLRQPATPSLRLEGGTGAGELDARLVALCRGRHELPAVASASCGPLGLARMHHPAGAPETVRVYPDLQSAQRLIGRLRRQLSLHPGMLAGGPLGLGTDFESVRDYTPSDDIRQLNWTATARTGRPMSNQYRLDSDRELLCLVDCGRLMTAPLGTRTMLDAALDAVTVLALAADELGDRCGAIAFDQVVRRTVPPGRLTGRRVLEELYDLEARPLDADYERAFVQVSGSRRSFIAVFTDLVDEVAARALAQAIPLLARRHAVLVASASDPALLDAATHPPGTPRQAAAVLVADDVLEARHTAAAGLARAGAQVVEAPAEQLAQRCLTAYLRSKSRVRF